MITLSLDGRTVPVEPGRTVLECARENGVHVPTLCHLQGLPDVATCRICLVEVEGEERPVPACTTPALEGMVVRTSTPRLEAHRRGIVELLLAGGGHVCAFCPAEGRCELQDLARSLGLDHVDPRGPHPAPPLDASRPRFALDPGRCVLCTRCVRACSAEGPATLHLTGRGARTRVGTDGGGRWADSPTCTDCGRCVAVCPTGALLEKAAAAQGLAVARAPPAVPGTAPEPLPAGANGPPLAPGARRARVATVWLGGCAGCHMSLLDLDERLLALAPRIELVYSPLADARDVPAGVDVCLVEGAVSTEDELALVRRVRARTRVLVAMGDCATSGNVTALRDGAGGAAEILRACWRCASPRDPALPALLDEVLPVHRVVPVDVFLPGCPPSADVLHAALTGLVPGGAGARPGAGG